MSVTLRCGASLTPRAFRLCVLDCDGVIFNSNRLKTEAYRATLREIGVQPDDVDAFVKLHLSDVSVSRFVKFQTFFSEVLPPAARPELCPEQFRGRLTVYKCRKYKLHKRKLGGSYI